ncbi:MAG: S41 family peptidase [Chloroflexi bacterium]|nr:S41 family peptidase [Chloroflexota bacterium]
MEQQSKTPVYRQTWFILLAGLLVILILAGGSFALGRMTAMPETITETTVETQEVTREVTRQVEVPAVADGGNGGTAVQETPTEAVQTEPAETTTEQPTAVPPAQETFTPRLEDVDDIEFDIFYEAWQVIEEDYDGDIPDNEEILYSAIEGSVKSLGDEYTRFVRPDVAARMREDAGGAVEGIGAFVRENEMGQFEIVRPIPGQPAEKAGLLPGDIIIGVDGQSVEDVSFDEVILMVRGPRGTDVTLTVLREGEEEPLEFTITRVRFEIPTVEFEIRDDGIAYIKLSEFNRTAVEKMHAGLEELLAQNPKGLVFDLRDDPGGFLDQSVAVADLFLGQGVVLHERNRQGLDQTFTSDDGDIAEDIPMVVLVNGGSASASEIVAGAIKDNGRAPLIGELTFGKGSVQQVHTLSDGSEIRVTIARWYTPNNVSISEEGITPDIEVPMEFDAEEDIQLQRAIEYLLTGE